MESNSLGMYVDMSLTTARARHRRRRHVQDVSLVLPAEFRKTTIVPGGCAVALERFAAVARIICPPPSVTSWPPLPPGCCCTSSTSLTFLRGELAPTSKLSLMAAAAVDDPSGPCKTTDCGCCTPCFEQLAAWRSKIGASCTR